MKNIAAILLLFSIASACSTGDDRILFSSGRKGNSDIYTMNLDGSDVRPVTRSSSEEWGAVWVGENEISFLRQEYENIVRVKKDLATGTEVEIMHPANCILDDKNALYDPRGGYQLFPCKGEVYYQDEQEIVCLTESIDGMANYPSWSSNENEVIITSNHQLSNDLYSVDLSSKELTKLTDNPANDERGEVSPNGKLLVFSSDRFEKGNQDIALMNLETKEVTRLTSSSGADLIARWAGDNENLLIGSNMDGNWEIYALNILDKNLIRLTNEESFDGDPRVFSSSK